MLLRELVAAARGRGDRWAMGQELPPAAGELKFELAARLRDEVSELKKELRQMEQAGHLK